MEKHSRINSNSKEAALIGDIATHLFICMGFLKGDMSVCFPCIQGLYIPH